MKLLYVVHRYAPFPGGSEVYVQAMAEESLSRGHDVTVYAGEHQGDLNGVKVTSNSSVFHDVEWDLIIVHGADVGPQNYVICNKNTIKSPILYLLILPSGSPASLMGMRDCDYIGWSTKEDIDYIRQHGASGKAVNVRHGVKYTQSIGTPGLFKREVGIPEDTMMFLSCGGYWQNKKMKELADLFLKANLKNAVLVTTGYDNRFKIAPEYVPNKIIPLMLSEKSDVMNAIADASAYIMHSDSEGFGLVLLESMLNKTMWISREIAGGKLLSKYGWTYNSDETLLHQLSQFEGANTIHFPDVQSGYDHVYKNHLISNTVDDIERVIRK